MLWSQIPADFLRIALDLQQDKIKMHMSFNENSTQLLYNAYIQTS